MRAVVDAGSLAGGCSCKLARTVCDGVSLGYLPSAQCESSIAIPNRLPLQILALCDALDRVDADAVAACEFGPAASRSTHLLGKPGSYEQRQQPGAWGWQLW